MKIFCLCLFLSIHAGFALQIQPTTKKNIPRKASISKQSSAFQAPSSSTMKRDTTLKKTLEQGRFLH
jgi:hypothetical protein